MEVINDELISKALTSNCKGEDYDDRDNIQIINYKSKPGNIGIGDNYCCHIKRISVEINRQNKRLTKNLILKIPFNIPIYELLDKTGLYDKECYMYNIILPKINELLGTENAISPNSYYSLNPKIIILDDLTENGNYVTYDRKKQLDFEHCKEALKLLGKFHATTYYINQIWPEKIEKVKRYNFAENSEFGKEMLEKGIMAMIEMLEKTVDGKKYIEKLKNIQNDVIDHIRNFIQDNQNGFTVLNHGDFWTCNLMFRYDDNDNDDMKNRRRIIDAKIIDFQMCYWCIPVIDIIYFSVTSIRYETYRDHINEILKVYLDSLNETLIKFDIEKRYTMTDLKSDMQKSKLHFVFFLCTICNFILSDLKEPVFEKTSGDEINFDKMYSTYKGKCFENVVLTWFKHFDEIGYW